MFRAIYLFIIRLYEVSLRVQSECGKIQTRKNSIFGHISHSECVHVSVDYTICKVSVTHFSECAVNVLRKVILSSLSVNTVSVPPINVVKVTTPRPYRHANTLIQPLTILLCVSLFLVHLMLILLLLQWLLL